MLSRLGAGEKAEAPETHLLGLPLPVCALWERTVLPGIWGPRGPGSIMRVQSGPHRGTNNGGPTGLGGPSLTQCTCLLAEFLQRGARKGPAQPHTAGPHGPICTGQTRKVQRPGGQTGRQSQGCRTGRATAAPGLTCWDHWNQPDVPSAVCGQQDRQSLTPTGSQNPGPPGSRVRAGRGQGRGQEAGQEDGELRLVSQAVRKKAGHGGLRPQAR